MVRIVITYDLGFWVTGFCVPSSTPLEYFDSLVNPPLVEGLTQFIIFADIKLSSRGGSMSLVLIVIALVVLNVAFAAWFHFSVKKKPVITEPAPEPAKLIDKTEAWTEPPNYNYDRTSIMGDPVTPIEPNDSEPPEPYQ